MSRREIYIVLIVGVVLALVAVMEYRRGVALAVAETKAENDKAAISQIEAAGKARNAELDRQSAIIAAQEKALDRMSSFQIAAQTQRFIPAAPDPVHAISKEEAEAINKLPDAPHVNAGDVFVPQSDVKPIAAQIVAGNQCKVDLTRCVGDRDDAIRKYELANDEAKQWKKAAGKGSPFMRAVKCIAIRGGVGAGTGAAFGGDNKGSAALGGLGIGTASCFIWR